MTVTPVTKLYPDLLDRQGASRPNSTTVTVRANRKKKAHEVPQISNWLIELSHSPASVGD